MKRVLITGGAGFIGSHVGDVLAEHGYAVRALDPLLPQIHGASRRPTYLSNHIELIRGDVRDPDCVKVALRGVDAVIHLAAAVGVGQSMYALEHYTSINELGTAVLLQSIADNPVERVVVASSMSIYGEGPGSGPDGTFVDSPERSTHQLLARDWDVRDECGVRLVPVPTPEWKTPRPQSVYALNKYVQELMPLITCKARGIPAIALRLFNVYGPRQSLSNPYTGVLAIFASKILNGGRPMIFEDGLQRRDFVHVRDVARAFMAALERPDVSEVAINVGSGAARSIRSVAHDLSEVMGLDVEPEVTGKFRSGDIRHCFADISLAKELLGFAPQVDFRDGLSELADYLTGQVAADRVSEATAELEARGLVA